MAMMVRGATGRNGYGGDGAILTATPWTDPDALIERALRHTVQTFPPQMNAGAFLIGETIRGPILPAYGTKERDRILRVYDQTEQNGLWQGAIAGLIKKIRSTPWEIKGDPYWANYYTAIFHHAQFGKGWGDFISLVMRDYLTQDYGAFIELIGPGDPIGPITGPLGDPWRADDDSRRYYGIAHKDSWRCYVTGNPTWPVVYYSLMTGALHRLHHSRIRRMVDMPNPDERYFGIGLCALSRCIGVASREIRMGRYIDNFLDDKPKPGINTVSGMTEEQRKAVVAKYGKEQDKDGGALFGRTLWFHSIDIDHPIEVKSIPFAQTPEKFDFTKYVELDVNSIALGLGMDRQELWELAGRGIGSGAQSAILAQKAEGKMYGDTLQFLERLFNLNFLPVGLEFRFKTKNTVGDTAQAQIDLQYSQMAGQLAQIPELTTGKELRRMLSNKSATFADAFTDDQGSVELDDSDVKRADQEVRLQDDAPAESAQRKPIDKTTSGAASAPNGKAPTIPSPKAAANLAQKDLLPGKGAMLALFLPDDAAQALFRQVSPALAALKATPIEPQDYHLTLVNLGDASQATARRQAIGEAILSLGDEDAARNALSGQVNGIGRFADSSDGQTNALYATFDAVALPEFRAQVMGLANQLGLAVEQNHGFIPHITLAYLPVDMPTPDIRLSPIAVRFDRLTLALGDERRQFSLDGDAYRAKDYQSTRDEFITSIVDLVSAKDESTRRRFGIVFRGQMRRLGQQAYQDGLTAGGVQEPLDEDDLAQVQHWMIAQSGYVSAFADEVYQKGLSSQEIEDRAELWANKSLDEMFNAGRLSADKNGMYEWVLGRTEKHCNTCKRLAGQRHRFKEWYARGLLPRGERLDCNGFRCSCQLVKTTEPARGRF